MIETNDDPQTLKGEVRIRSNVCTDPNAWHLVPGDVIKTYGLSRQDLTSKQRQEMMYYERCCICHRTIFEILEDGCDRLNCREQGIVSTAQARQLRSQRLIQDEQKQF